MTIGQMISKQKDEFNSVYINYTDENGICWHIQLPLKKAKKFDVIMQCRYQSFEETLDYYGEEHDGIFSIIVSDIPENIIQKSDFVFPKTSQPAKKSDSECNEMIVRDYIHARNDVKKIKFGLNTMVGCWYTDTVNVQKSSSLMSSLENLFVDNATMSTSEYNDERVLQIFLQGQARKKRKRRKKQLNMTTILYTAFCIGVIVSAIFCIVVTIDAYYHNNLPSWASDAEYMRLGLSVLKGGLLFAILIMFLIFIFDLIRSILFNIEQ